MQPGLRRRMAPEAKSNLSQLLKRVSQGLRSDHNEERRPVAELIPYRRPKRKKIRLGFGAGQVQFTEGWDKAMTDEEVEAFFGGRS
jgi:antitoxin (DNA-binding transcriptional repressor) of toxin-antitoxin stability system